jgi:hypothetical protein
MDRITYTGTVLAIDPGNEESAFVLYDGTLPVNFGKWPNESLLREIQVGKSLESSHCAIETLKPRGMPTSFEEMQTQLWAGRYFQAWYDRQGGDKFALSSPTQVFRMDVKMFHCNRSTAKDSNIRQALIDRFGGANVAIGGKKCPKCKGKGWTGRNHDPCPEWLHPPGPLKGITEDCWSALAIAVYWCETKFTQSLTRGA